MGMAVCEYENAAAETPVTCNASSVDACVSGDEKTSDVPLTFKCVSSNYNLFHKAESAGRMSDVRTPKRRINIMKTDATEHRTNSQMAANAALIALFRAGVIATFRLVPGTCVSSRSGGGAK